MRWVTWAVVVSSVAAACGEGPECPDLDCAEELVVHFQGSPLDAAGAWTLVFDTPGATVTCTVELPNRQLDPFGSVCDSQYLRLSFDQGADGHVAIDGFRIHWDAPDELVVTIARDGEVQHVVDVSPSYEDEPRPGGDECGPPCKRASEIVELQ